MHEGIRTERVGSAMVWTLDRPESRNAIDESTARRLELELEAAEGDPTLRALVVTGAGSAAFVSGADLTFLRTSSPERRAQLHERMSSLLARLQRLPCPVIAALNGPAVGGGAELALACDIRVAEPHASMTFKHAAMGLSPGWGGFRRLAAQVGRGSAAKLLLIAAPMPALEACRVGLIDEVTEPGLAKQRARELADAATLLSPSAVAEMKRGLGLAYGSCGLTPEEERRIFLARSRSLDHAEALLAFSERRGVRFCGRGEG